MMNVTTSISLSSTILTHYEAIYHYHLHNGVFVSQLIRYARASFTHDQFLKRGKLLTSKLKKHFRSFYGHTTTLSAILSYQQVQSPFGRMLADVYQFYCQAIITDLIVYGLLSFPVCYLQSDSVNGLIKTTLVLYYHCFFILCINYNCGTVFIHI